MQIVRTERPFNSEPTPDSLCRDPVTPVESFYVRNHGAVPDLDGGPFRIAIDGAVDRPAHLSLHDLRTAFEKVSVMAALQCAGNRRCEMIAVQPIPGEVPWGCQTIGNAVWSGARLRDVLTSVGARPSRDARYISFLGADEIDKNGKIIGFGASVSMEKAMAPECLLAYEMNGLPLTPAHGAPLRALIPGYIGARSVKWLASVSVDAAPTENFYQSKSYKMFPPDVNASNVDWTQGRTLEDVALNSVICHPSDGAQVAAGSMRITGYAVGAGGAAVDRVEVSLDGGALWRLADVIGKREPWRWNLWELHVEFDPGRHSIAVRARDAAGNEQPADGKPLWNFKGYMWNAWHRVNIEVMKG